MKLRVAHAAQAALNECSLSQHPLNLSRLSLHYKVGKITIFTAETLNASLYSASVFSAPPGAKVSDVQSRRHVDLCQVQFKKDVVSFNDNRLLTVFDSHQELCVPGAGLCMLKYNVVSFVC